MGSYGRCLLAVLLLAASCSPQTTAQNRGFDPYLQGASEIEEAQTDWLDDEERRGQLEELLANPLGMKQALEVALLNNPGLQADLAEVDIREGTLRQDAAIANPDLHSEFYIYGPDSSELYRVEASLEFDLTSVLGRAARIRATREGVEASRVQAAGRILDFADEVRRAWIYHVAARHFLEHQEQINQAAEAAAETAQIYHDAGNLADDELYRILTFAAEAREELFRAQADAGDHRDKLALLLGLPVDGNWSTPGQLAQPPEESPLVHQLEDQAIERSTLLQQLESEGQRQRALASASRWDGWLPALRLGAIADWREGEVEMGPTLGVAIPIFDRRGAERDAIRARQIQLDFQRDQQINRIRTFSARVTRRLQQSRSLAMHYGEEVLPLRERVVEESLRQYNAMNIGVFELLDARRAHLEAEADYVEALRDFWLASADYEHLVAGGTSGADQAFGDAEH